MEFVKTYRFKGLQARRRREELGMTAREVAAVVGVSESAVCAYERANRQPRGAIYIKLCHTLQVELDDLREPREPGAEMAGSAA